jgi:hypothetical protein
MADDIKIRVGVQNNVKAGMNGVVRDIERETSRLGTSSKGATGRGFMEGFMKLSRGDISGLIADLQERLGAGMSSIAGKMLLWGGGIATALVAGFKAGQQLDAALGLSDKISAALVNRFGTMEDDALKQKVAAMRKSRETIEAEKKKDIESQIKMIEEENAVIEEAEKVSKERAIFDAEARQLWNKHAKAAATEQDAIGRITGRPNEDFQATADRSLKIGLDRNFYKQEKQAEKDANKMRRRQEKLQEMSDADALAGRKSNPQIERFRRAMEKQEQADMIKKNLDDLQKRANEAQIEAMKNAKITADNTGLIKDMQKQLLTLKGGN